jgi:hypothetical protein
MTRRHAPPTLKELPDERYTLVALPMEKNTYTTSVYIDAPVADVVAYLTNGMNLNEYTLHSRMREQIDEHTWLGSASGYQSSLYYHVRSQNLESLQIIEWHCGVEYGSYYQVYPMLMFPASYFPGEGREQGTHYHWISFVDPERGTQMIFEGMAPVHTAEAHSLKAVLERRAGHRRPIAASLELRAHTIYVDAPAAGAAAYFADPGTADEWGFLLRRARASAGHVDEYDNSIEIRTRLHELGEHYLVEHDTHYLESGAVVRAPILLVPATYAFARPGLPGFIMHRITAWPAAGARAHGKSSPAHYDAEAINAKRILEGRAGNRETFARGCSYLPGRGD